LFFLLYIQKWGSCTTERAKNLCRDKKIKKEELCIILSNTALGIGSRDWTLNTRAYERRKTNKRKRKKKLEGRYKRKIGKMASALPGDFP